MAPWYDSRPLLRVFLSGPDHRPLLSRGLRLESSVRARLADAAPHAECGDPMRGRKHLADIGPIDTDSHKAGLVDGHAAVARDLWMLIAATFY